MKSLSTLQVCLSHSVNSVKDLVQACFNKSSCFSFVLWNIDNQCAIIILMLLDLSHYTHFCNHCPQR